MELVVALVVLGAAFGLGYWQLRQSGIASIWVVVGLAVAAAILGLVLGFLFGAFAVFVIGVVAGALLVFGYRWYAGRERAGTAPASVSTVPSPTALLAEKVCPDCAELIKRDARVCRHCGHRFAEPPDDPEPPMVRAEPEPAAAPAARAVGNSQAAAAAATVAEFAPEGTVTEAASGQRARFCARCGEEFEADAEFCGTCGGPRP